MKPHPDRSPETGAEAGLLAGDILERHWDAAAKHHPPPKAPKPGKPGKPGKERVRPDVADNSLQPPCPTESGGSTCPPACQSPDE